MGCNCIEKRRAFVKRALIKEGRKKRDFSVYCLKDRTQSLPPSEDPALRKGLEQQQGAWS